MKAPEDQESRPELPTIEDFLGEPTRDLDAWRWLWEGDHAFPVRTHRGVLGSIAVAIKRVLRPFLRTATADLWDRQRVFNLILLEHLWHLDHDRTALAARTEKIETELPRLEAFLSEGLQELMRYDDALYGRVDQKLDRYRRQAGELSALLGAAVARCETEGSSSVEGLARAVEERDYAELENRYRGTSEEIQQRLSIYLDLLAGRKRVVDLGCGRGEALQVLAEHGVAARGVDASAEMVRACAVLGLAVEEAELLAFLAAAPEGSFDALLSFHVIEHLPRQDVARLVRLAWRALEPGGLLILETPNPRSLVVAASHFWRDPTHRRPIHPDALRLSVEMAGFEDVEIRDLHPFSCQESLPELDVAALQGGEKALAHEINVLRDRLDETLFGFQDYAVIARK